MNGERNPSYRGVFVFDNDHPCVARDAPVVATTPPPPYRSAPARGVSRVVSYTPRHDLSLGELDADRVRDVLAVLGAQTDELTALDGTACVLAFENRGEVVGVSNPHPHCQIYATSFVFKTIAVEAEVCRRHFDETGRGLFQDILGAEHADGRRIVAANDSAVAFVPYFARYAYELLVAPRASHAFLSSLSAAELRDLAAVLREALVRLDNLWCMPCPYVMALHQAPATGVPAPGFHFHIEIHPPLRKPHLLKYLAGPEIGGGNFLADTSPEEKAAELRSVSPIHYRDLAGPP